MHRSKSAARSAQQEHSRKCGASFARFFGSWSFLPEKGNWPIGSIVSCIEIKRLYEGISSLSFLNEGEGRFIFSENTDVLVAVIGRRGWAARADNYLARMTGFHPG